MTTVVIADDHALQRFGFRMLLESQDDLTLLGEAAHGAEAVRMVAELQPDVVLMDVRMPGLDGIEATRRIVASGGRTRVLILTTFDLDAYAYAGLRAGASGFLVKDAQPGDLLSGIRAVASGDAVVAPALTRRLLDAFADRLFPALPDLPGSPEPQAPYAHPHPHPHPHGPAYGDGSGHARRPERADPRLADLTEREREVLVAIGHGWNNTEIAARLSLAESTVKTHVGRVLAKTGVRDRVQAVILAYNTGLVRPE